MDDPDPAFGVGIADLVFYISYRLMKYPVVVLVVYGVVEQWCVLLRTLKMTNDDAVCVDSALTSALALSSLVIPL